MLRQQKSQVNSWCDECQKLSRAMHCWQVRRFRISMLKCVDNSRIFIFIFLRMGHQKGLCAPYAACEAAFSHNMVAIW